MTVPDSRLNGVADVGRDDSCLTVGTLRIPHRTIRLCLLLLPVWLLGAGELGRLALNNAVPGNVERTGAVKGRDFVQFYVAGALAREGAWDALYDVPELERAVARIVPEAAGQIPAPVYGPQVAVFFSQWSRLPYQTARWSWFAASTLLYLLAAILVIRTAAPVREHRVLAWLTILCNPLFSTLLSAGQISAIGVVSWALAAAAFSAGHMGVFGACLGILVYKPTLFAGVLLVLVLVGRRTALAGLILSATAQIAAGVLVAGVEPWQRYWAALTSLSAYYFLTDTVPHQKQSLSGFFQILTGSGIATALLSSLGVCAIGFLWLRHRREPLTVWFAPMLATTTVLLSPHLYVYDLVVLMPSLMMATYAISQRRQWAGDQVVVWCGYALLYAPYSGALALRTGIQTSTIVLVVLLVMLHRRWTDETRQTTFNRN